MKSSAVPFSDEFQASLLNARLTLLSDIPEGRASIEIDLMHLNVALMNLIKMKTGSVYSYLWIFR